MVYESCVACSGSLVGSGQVRTCSRCGGVHVEARSIGFALSVVDFSVLAPQAPEERYFDVTYPDANGARQRVHGWYDPTTRKMTQIG